MARVEKTLEMRGMPREEYINYFINIGGALKEDGTYAGESWTVRIGPQVNCALGPMSVPSVKITFFIEDYCCDEMLSSFRLRFLCAGG